MMLIKKFSSTPKHIFKLSYTINQPEVKAYSKRRASRQNSSCPRDFSYVKRHQLIITNRLAITLDALKLNL